MTDEWIAVEQWASMGGDVESCIVELRARVEALEGKYQTMRAATLEWGKDVENLQRWSDQHLMRIERLEGIKPKMVNLQLTPEQDEGIAALLRPNYPAKPDSSLVERVQAAIGHSYPDDARAAIREVAAWLREQGTPASGWAMRLEQEAER
jgi:hypothetical protein